MIFRTYKNVILRIFHSLGWLLWLCFYPTQMFLHWDDVVCEEQENDFVHVKGGFVIRGWLIACDLREAMLGDDLGEDHVRLFILYCLDDISAIMNIWRWPLLTQTILHGHSWWTFLKSYDDNPISDVDAKGIISVKKKTFHKKKKKAFNVDVPMLKIDKLMFKESIRNVGVVDCCSLNCYQCFPHEKIALMKEEFWKMSYENQKAYDLDISQWLHSRVDVKKQKLITI